MSGAFKPGMRVALKSDLAVDDIELGGGYYGHITGPCATLWGPAWKVDLTGHVAGKPIPFAPPEWFFPDELEVVD